MIQKFLHVYYIGGVNNNIIVILLVLGVVSSVLGGIYNFNNLLYCVGGVVHVVRISVKLKP